MISAGVRKATPDRYDSEGVIKKEELDKVPGRLDRVTY
jgi:hypothetical protein